MNQITTVAGRGIQIMPVARILGAKIRHRIRKEYEERGEVLDIPTYFVKTAAGDTQEFPHDEKTILEAPQDEVDRWRKYHETISRFDYEVSAAVTKMSLYKGIVIDRTEMDKALKEQSRFGIDVPEDEIDRTVHYITTELLPTTLDIIKATQAITILSLSGIEEETLHAVEDSFRRAMEKAGRPDIAAITNTDTRTMV